MTVSTPKFLTIPKQVQPVRQTMLNYLDDEGEKYIEKKFLESLNYNDNELSGVFAIDEQFPFVNGEKMARPVIMDVWTNTILNGITIPIDELDFDFKEKFLKDTLKRKNNKRSSFRR